MRVQKFDYWLNNEFKFCYIIGFVLKLPLKINSNRFYEAYQYTFQIDVNTEKKCVDRFTAG